MEHIDEAMVSAQVLSVRAAIQAAVQAVAAEPKELRLAAAVSLHLL
jgi:hypothetical protein